MQSRKSLAHLLAQHLGATDIVFSFQQSPEIQAKIMFWSVVYEYVCECMHFLFWSCRHILFFTGTVYHLHSSKA